MQGIIKHLKVLHRDERGAEGLEKLLIVAAIVLPLLGVLIWFRNDIKDWVKTIWESAKGEGEKLDPAKPY
jgi:Flp pilus assembly pilin Flp